MERNLVYIVKAISVKYEDTNVIVDAQPNFDIVKKWIKKVFSLD